ncbi:MAG: FAD-dependent oxidoreductase, partial [Chromatiaceae bacterium]
SFASDPPLPYDGLFFDRCPIAWAARNSSKPGRRGNTWVVHASPDWTRTRLDVPAEAIAAELTSALATHTGIDPTAVTRQSAHRWLYSLAENPLDAGALWEPDLGLAVCGDWCLGARIEAAYLSGQAAAGRVLGHLAGETRAAEARQPAHTANAKSAGG